MKALLCIVTSLASLAAAGQLNKPVSVLATGNLMYKTKGFNHNDAGVGLHVSASFFSTHKLQLLVEMGAERFFGDKVYYIGPRGEGINKVSLYSVKAGPQVFITPHIALSATFGKIWHSINAEVFTESYGLQYGATGFIGRKKRFVARVFAVHNLKNNEIARYAGGGLGYRIY